MMNDDQLNELESEFKKFLASEVESRFEVLSRKVDTLQHSIDRIDKDLEADRRDIGDFKIHMGTIRHQFEEVLDSFNRQTKTIVEKVEDKINEGIDSASQMMSESVRPTVEGALDDFVSTAAPIEKKKRRFLFWKRK